MSATRKPQQPAPGGHGKNPTPPNPGDHTSGQEPTAEGEHLRTERAPTADLDKRAGGS